MSNDLTLGSWPNEPPSPSALIKQVRHIAARDDASVLFSHHAEARLLQRGYNDRDVIRGFRIGDIEGPVLPGNKSGEWQCEVVFPGTEERGSRNIGVVTIVQRGNRLFVKTVMWKDKR